MAFCGALFHAGLLPALFVFLVWSLPGAIGMYAFSLGVQKIDEVLPTWAYALLSGLNAATVGIIALAAVQLAKKAITDPLTRLLVAGGGCAGLCYNALWYFPTIMVVGGIVTVLWDAWISRLASNCRLHLRNWRAGRSSNSDSTPVDEDREAIAATAIPAPSSIATTTTRRTGVSAPPTAEREPIPDSHPAPAVAITMHNTISIRTGIAVIIGFFISFIIFMVLRAVLTNSPLTLQLFTNMYLAGTVIFGGGPVVIPLLREYVVEPGWVTPRNFLLGLAVIQAFPGPNFNFAVYLGALTLAGTDKPTFIGALIGFLGIFFPGLTLALGFQSLWRAIRRNRKVVSVLRGLNATAVGLVFTAVYRLWEIGYLTAEETDGQSLGKEPWWLVVAATTYTFVEWFKVPPAAAILGGGVLGLVWFGVVG